MTTLIKGTGQVILLCIFSLIMNRLVDVFHLKIPGSILGILVVFILLQTKIIRLEWVELGAKWLSDMLQPATIAFAVPLYKYFHILKKHATEIIVSVLSGSIVAIISSMLIAEGLHLHTQVVNSLIPRSVTTPIAMGISKHWWYPDDYSCICDYNRSARSRHRSYSHPAITH